MVVGGDCPVDASGHATATDVLAQLDHVGRHAHSDGARFLRGVLSGSCHGGFLGLIIF